MALAKQKNKAELEELLVKLYEELEPDLKIILKDINIKYFGNESYDKLEHWRECREVVKDQPKLIKDLLDKIFSETEDASGLESQQRIILPDGDHQQLEVTGLSGGLSELEKIDNDNGEDDKSEMETELKESEAKLVKKEGRGDAPGADKSLKEELPKSLQKVGENYITEVNNGAKSKEVDLHTEVSLPSFESNLPKNEVSKALKKAEMEKKVGEDSLNEIEITGKASKQENIPVSGELPSNELNSVQSEMEEILRTKSTEEIVKQGKSSTDSTLSEEDTSEQIKSETAITERNIENENLFEAETLNEEIKSEKCNEKESKSTEVSNENDALLGKEEMFSELNTKDENDSSETKASRQIDELSSNKGTKVSQTKTNDTETKDIEVSSTQDIISTEEISNKEAIPAKNETKEISEFDSKPKEELPKSVSIPTDEGFQDTAKNTIQDSMFEDISLIKTSPPQIRILDENGKLVSENLYNLDELSEKDHEEFEKQDKEKDGTESKKDEAPSNNTKEGSSRK